MHLLLIQQHSATFAGWLAPAPACTLAPVTCVPTPGFPCLHSAPAFPTSALKDVLGVSMSLIWGWDRTWICWLLWHRSLLG